ncbi:MAG TPA: prepilin-type N-terminal cleavage/methylation domain-containing protein [Verrucomicrobiae bacterium]|nr:prepilin-type N-terminal cleavage/methylation domain-containing protein [Verrucomicrobiae bacterium]
MKTPPTTPARSARGFTLIEMSISMGIVAILTIAMFDVFCQVCKFYNETTLMSATAKQASLGLDRMVIGIGTNAGLREAQQSTVTTSSTSSNWVLSYDGSLSFTYSTNKHTIVDQSGKCIVTNLVASTIANLTNGVQISLSVAQSCGGKTVTNTMATFVQFRN